MADGQIPFTLPQNLGFHKIIELVGEKSCCFGRVRLMLWSGEVVDTLLVAIVVSKNRIGYTTLGRCFFLYFLICKILGQVQALEEVHYDEYLVDITTQA